MPEIRRRRHLFSRVQELLRIARIQENLSLLLLDPRRFRNQNRADILDRLSHADNCMPRRLGR